jgi:hypothetical protein
LQVVDEDVGSLIGQGQLDRVPVLPLGDQQGAAMPVDVVEGQSH